MDVISTLSIALGSSWVSGLNLYAAVATLGLLQRFGWATLPSGLETLSEPWVIGIAGALYAVEFVADKVPYVDSVWDTVHTFIRVPAGAVLATAAFADYSPGTQVVAFLLGGGVAATSHAAKASTRAVLNLSPEPISNWIASTIEDVSAVIGIVVAIVVPILMIVFVLLFCIAAWLLIPRAIRLVRRATSFARPPAQTPAA
jgi:hypothetical protein